MKCEVIVRLSTLPPPLSPKRYPILIVSLVFYSNKNKTFLMGLIFLDSAVFHIYIFI